MRRSGDWLMGPALVCVVLAAGCGAQTDATPGPDTTSRTVGTFAAYKAGSTAVTYDPSLAPAGATAIVTMTPAASGVEVRLAVTGLKPNRAYGAHLHTKPCGATGEAAGPHYQHQPDPAASASPSVNPSYANPHNEVWLDFTTDAQGAATSSDAEQWTFDPQRRPKSLIIHADKTMTAAGHAGTAGARIACLTLPD